MADCCCAKLAVAAWKLGPNGWESWPGRNLWRRGHDGNTTVSTTMPARTTAAKGAKKQEQEECVRYVRIHVYGVYHMASSYHCPAVAFPPWDDSCPTSAQSQSFHVPRSQFVAKVVPPSSQPRGGGGDRKVLCCSLPTLSSVSGWRRERESGWIRGGTTHTPRSTQSVG